MTSLMHTYMANIPTISGIDIALWDIRHVGVHERGHVLKVDLDRQRVLADEQRLHCRDASAGHGAGHAGFAITDDAGVGFDLDETVAGDAVDLHRFDVGDLDSVPLRGDERVESGEDAGHGQGHREAEQFTTSEGCHNDPGLYREGDFAT